MKWISENQALFEWDPLLTTHTTPGPLHTAVAGFAKGASDMNSLDIEGWMELTVLADFIVRSFDARSLPIVGVRSVGHADDTPSPDKEQRLSEERAKAVQQFLKDKVEAKAAPLGLSKAPSGTPSIMGIDWKSRGVGALQPDPDNVKQKKTSPYLSEADRKRNRRVEIVLEPADKAIPDDVQPLGQAAETATSQIVFGYTLVPELFQNVWPKPDPLDPIHTLHQFSLAIKPKDDANPKLSFQGSVTLNDFGKICSIKNLQGGMQIEVATPLLNGWIEVSGFVQLMIGVNWNKLANGTALIVPVFQPAAGGQVVVKPKFSGGLFRFLEFGIQVQANADVPIGPPMAAPFGPGPSAGVQGAFIINIPFDL